MTLGLKCKNFGLSVLWFCVYILCPQCLCVCVRAPVHGAGVGEDVVSLSFPYCLDNSYMALL